MLWLEVAVILLLTWLPAIISGVDNRYRGPVTFTYEIYEMAGSLGRIAVVLFIVLTADGDLDQLGITRSKWTVDLPLAVALAAGLYFIDQAYRLLPRSVVAGLVGHSSLAYRSLLYNLPLWLVFLSLVMAVLFEEVVFRAYLITRLTELLANPWLAIVVSAALFGSGHLYQGVLGVSFAIVCGVTFGIVFVKTKRIWPSLLAHLALDGFLYFRFYELFVNGRH